MRRIAFKQPFTGWIGFVFGWLAGTTVTVVMIVQSNALVRPQELVYQACNAARMASDLHDNACGSLQLRLGYEFLCERNDTSPQTHCWVERP